MSEPTLADLVDKLSEALTEYQSVVNRMFEIHSQRIQLADTMITELRDDTHESLTALSNRIQAVTSGD